MSGEEWVSAKDAFERIKGHSDDPGQFLLRLARNGSVKTRALLVSWDKEQQECGRFRLRNSNEMKPNFWVAVFQTGWVDWADSSFGFDETAPSELFGIGETLHWTAKGIEFNWSNIRNLLSSTSDAIDLSRGKLPKGAKRIHRKYETLAHAAADIIRADDSDRSKAIRKVLDGLSEEELDKDIQRTSIEMAVRRAFDLMYTPNGLPLEN